MKEEPSSTPPGPLPGESATELVQLSLKVPDLLSPVGQPEILTALRSREGVKEVHQISDDTLHIVYDPLYVSAHEMEALLQREGHPGSDEQTERDSPFDPE